MYGIKFNLIHLEILEKKGGDRQRTVRQIGGQGYRFLSLKL